MMLLRSILTIGGFTLLSRILGFIRDILVAAILGAGSLADIFFVSFKAPNLFRRLFAEGAFNAAFVPQLSGVLSNKGKLEAEAFVEQILAVLFWFLLIFLIIFEIFMPVVILVFAPGFFDDSEKFNLTVLLTRITFPYLLFISLVSLMSGVLNTFGKFASAAAAPILLNICLIGSLVLLSKYTETPAHALAWGVTFAGMVQFLWLLGNCTKSALDLRLVWPRFTENVKTTLRRFIPAAIGAGVYQLSILIDTIIASFLPTGSVSYLFYADRVNQLPLGVVGVAVGTALLPILSRQIKSGEDDIALTTQNRAIEFALFLTLPAAIALSILSQPIVSVLFQRGAFDLTAAEATSGALAIYAAGLPAFIIVKVLNPAFFARDDTRMPVKIASFSLLTNLILNLIFMGPYQHLGIAAATAISTWGNAIALAFVLKKRGHLTFDQRTRKRIPRALLIAFAMGFLLFTCQLHTNDLFYLESHIKIITLSCIILAGLLFYFLMSFLLGTVDLRDIKRLMIKTT